MTINIEMDNMTIFEIHDGMIIECGWKKQKLYQKWYNLEFCVDLEKQWLLFGDK